MGYQPGFSPPNSTQCKKPINPTPMPNAISANQMSTNSAVSNATYTTTYAGSNWQNPQKTYNPQYGWECPRCHCINAPWVRQCECKGSYYYTTITSGDCNGTININNATNSISLGKSQFVTPTIYNTAYCLNQDTINQTTKENNNAL